MHPGILGGIIGSALGILGGAVGTWFSIRNTSGPRERALMVKASIVCWLGIGLFLGLLFWIPSPWKFLLWIPYGIALPLGIRAVNRAQQSIRAEERVSGHGQ